MFTYIPMEQKNEQPKFKTRKKQRKYQNRTESILKYIYNKGNIKELLQSEFIKTDEKFKHICFNSKHTCENIYS